jgi:hypothetical protein
LNNEDLLLCRSESGLGVSKEIGLAGMGGSALEGSFNSKEATPCTGASWDRDKGLTNTVGTLSALLGRPPVGENPSTSGVAADNLDAVPGYVRVALLERRLNPF